MDVPFAQIIDSGNRTLFNFGHLFDEILSNTMFDTVELNDSKHFEIVKHFINLMLNTSKLRGNWSWL